MKIELFAGGRGGAPNIPRKNMELERGKGLVVPTACYSAEMFSDNKKHSRE